jgi:hypothetical protein
MKQGLFRRLRTRWIPAVVGAALVPSVLVYLFLVRTPHPPPALVMAACRDAVSGTHRIDSDFGTQFDVSEKDFTVRSGERDMPPGRLYVVTPKGRSTKIVIWHDDGIFNDLKITFPVFSEHVEERDVRIGTGRRVGTDRWGYLESRERWRYVSFSWGDAVGYWPTSPKEADMLDQVINSACFLSPSDRRDQSNKPGHL